MAETLQPRVEPSLTSWIDRLLKEVIRLSNLVDDVLNMSSLEQGRSPLAEEERINLVSVVQAAWQSIEPLAKLTQLSLDYQGPEELIINFNASLMHRVLFNLLSNAVKYSPPKQMIQVRLSVAPPVPSTSPAPSQMDRSPVTAGDPESATYKSSLLIEVIDAGTGLDKKDLPFVFDRFYRADLARSHESGADIAAADENAVEIAELSSSGTGLGLAIVRQIVESNQGRVEAKKQP